MGQGRAGQEEEDDGMRREEEEEHKLRCIIYFSPCRPQKWSSHWPSRMCFRGEDRSRWEGVQIPRNNRNIRYFTFPSN